MVETVDREDWKARYRDLLEEVEQMQGDWQSRDSALRSVASRLAIAAMGRDALVDRHLNAIHDAIKANQRGDEIQGELEALAAAVLQQENRASASDDVDLSGFVASLAMPHDLQKRCIDGLESEQPAQRLQALNDLASELNALLQAPAPGEAATEDRVRQVLETLVSHVDGVPGLEAPVNELRSRLDAGLTDDEQETLLQNLGKAVSTVIRSIAEDKEELEAFLEQVTNQLAQFENWASGSESDHEARRQDADSLERSVEQEVGGLKSDIEASGEMSDLKQRVQLRLDAIADQLKVFRRNEEQRATEAGKRNAALREEVNRLKVRTAELAERCNAQEDRLMHDTLTGVHTRYAYDQRMQEEFQRWQRHGQALSYSIWDIDFFKKVNDSYGHQAGDRLLAAVAGILCDSTRVEDFVARIGGEEFVVLFPATSLEMAAPLAERLREKVAAAGFHFRGTPIPVTVSCGITEFRADDTPKSVYDRADQALYQAKDSGRNRCIQD